MDEVLPHDDGVGIVLTQFPHHPVHRIDSSTGAHPGETAPALLPTRWCFRWCATFSGKS
ncbi:hypothetical protein [Lentzea terrae]|uniref:hypothetical protein n=1 Tax=Lentzea terrae TaxID=2200761 RepID=UPI0018E54775|nr:hypothetical protein [Lentzea terrae]